MVEEIIVRERGGMTLLGKSKLLAPNLGRVTDDERTKSEQPHHQPLPFHSVNIRSEHKIRVTE